MLGLLIGLAITAIAATLILKNYQPQTVLLVAGLLLLGLTVVLFPDNSILYQKAKSVGWKGLDIFAFVKDSLTTQIAGIGLIIMSAAAFADYMDHIGATGTMVRICIKPLKIHQGALPHPRHGLRARPASPRRHSERRRARHAAAGDVLPDAGLARHLEAGGGGDDRPDRVHGSRAGGRHGEPRRQDGRHAGGDLLRPSPDPRRGLGSSRWSPC